MTILHKDQTIDDIIENWLLGKASKTIRDYKRITREARVALEEEGLDLLSSVDKVEEVLRWYLHGPKQDGEPASPSTKAQRKAALESFFSHCLQHRIITQNPVEYIKMGKVEMYANTYYLTEQELLAGLENIDRNTYLGKRDYAFLLFMVATGNRVTATRCMHIGDLKGSEIFLWDGVKRGKTKRQKIPKRALAALLEWIEVSNPTDRIFNFEESWGQLIVKKYYGEKVHPHTFRTSAAIVHYKKHTDPELLRKFLGQTNINTILYYINAFVTEDGAEKVEDSIFG